MSADKLREAIERYGREMRAAHECAGCQYDHDEDASAAMAEALAIYEAAHAAGYAEATADAVATFSQTAAALEAEADALPLVAWTGARAGWLRVCAREWKRAADALEQRAHVGAADAAKGGGKVGG